MNKSRKIIFLEKILRAMVKSVLRWRKPIVIGITGSVGKSSTKEAVFLALKHNYKVRKSEENYNNEIGIPLTIIGAKTGGKNPCRWLLVFAKWLKIFIWPFGYPNILILEMAIDRPGDMKYLTDFIKPQIGVLTDVSSSHMEFFGSIDHLAREKATLIKNIAENGLAILNADNELVGKVTENINRRKIFYGIENSKATINASDVHFNYFGDELKGISFKLNYKGKTVPFRLPHIIAKHQVYPVLVATAVANYFKINLIEVAKSLEEFKAPRGRMNLLAGVNGSLIIDDTYNASPTSVLGALNSLKNIKARRRIVILGDMLELGKKSEEQHRNVLKDILAMNIDALILVGNRMQSAVKDILQKQISLKERVFFFDNPADAGKAMREKIKKGDLILIKGSQSMRMEKAVQEIIADRNEAGKLLCRQSRQWLKKEFEVPEK